MLQIIGLTKRFREKAAVDCLDLAVSKGEFFALLGPNAAGKTTTVKMITGLLKPNSGRIIIGGYDISQHPVKAKSFIGYVPDVPFLYEKLTVSETLDFIASVYGLSGEEKNRARERMLSMFDLTGLTHVMVEELSHGFRQRLVFAMVMIHRPEIAIVDEPLVGLDPRSARSVKDSLKKYTRGGGAVFMCTHTLSVAEELADRIGILNNGRLVAVGTVAELKRMCGRVDKLEEAFLRITGEEKNGG
jgi:ABC-2 type transport system ATP-binding protein